MNNLTAIVKATRASASALAAAQRFGREIEELERKAAQLRETLREATTPSRFVDARVPLDGVLSAIAAKTKARRAAHRRWTNAQAVLAANTLPGDAK